MVVLQKKQKKTNIEVEEDGNAETIAKGSFGVPVGASGTDTGDDDIDLEKGVQKEAAPNDGAPEKAKEDQTREQDAAAGGFFSNRVAQVLCCLVTLLVIVGIILAIVLTRDDGDGSRGAPGTPSDTESVSSVWKLRNLPCKILTTFAAGSFTHKRPNAV